MPPPTLRPPIPAKLIRIAAAFLESGLLVTVGVMFLSGSIQDPEAESSKRLPIHVGISVVPILLVSWAYAIQRVVRPCRFAFMLAGALVCALGGALCAGIEPLQRLLDALRGFVAGGIVMGFLMAVDTDTTALLEGGAQPGHEVFVAIMLVTLGALPSGIFGGFVLALPTIVTGAVLLVRCIRYDAPIVVPRKSAGAAFRVFLAMLFVLLALGFLVVCPLLSLGMMRLR